MESLICELHLPELNELSEQSSVQAHSAWQRMSRAGPRLGSVPSLEISALYDSVPSRVSRAELALLTLPSLIPCYRICRAVASQNFRWLPRRLQRRQAVGLVVKSRRNRRGTKDHDHDSRHRRPSCIDYEGFVPSQREAHSEH